jgi:hypothetical protein
MNHYNVKKRSGEILITASSLHALVLALDGLGLTNLEIIDLLKEGHCRGHNGLVLEVLDAETIER